MNLYAPLLEKGFCGPISLEGDQLHHFRNVLRGKSGSQVKLFNGNGLIFQGRVDDVSKKSLAIEVMGSSPAIEISKKPCLAIGVPKKEYLESILRSAMQIGVDNIKLIQTKFSPWVYQSYPRLEKIMISTMLQCENPSLPKIEVYESLEEYLNLGASTLLFATELEEASVNEVSLQSIEDVFIGPEGGFHLDEINLFRSATGVQCVRLASPIMKAEVAVPYCLGWSTRSLV